jgi:hypothetical protein
MPTRATDNSHCRRDIGKRAHSSKAGKMRFAGAKTRWWARRHDAYAFTAAFRSLLVATSAALLSSAAYCGRKSLAQNGTAAST